MKKSLIAVACLFALCAASWADTASDIAVAGDAKWDQLVAQAKKDDNFIELVTPDTIVTRFKNFEGKVMLFPKIDFGDFVTDKDGNKYYWYGEKNSDDIYVIKYDSRIQDQLLKLNSALGTSSGQYEVLGKLTDAWEWWGNVIVMDVVAMRVKGKACVLMDGGAPKLVGQDILDKYMAGKAANWSAGIPANATAVPSGLDPESVAKWFLYYGSAKKNDVVWKQLLSVDEGAIDAKGNLQAKGESWWRMISKTGREYYFVRANADRGDANVKYFMYQIKVNGADVGNAKPMVVAKQKSGEWKVTSF
jgi:hypothetical protein